MNPAALPGAASRRPPGFFLAAISNRNIMSYKKSDCLHFITRYLIRASDWRKVQAVRFPDDLRNERAAKELLRLATSAEEIGDHHWQELSRYFDPENEGWRELVSQAARDVAFRSHPQTFEAFVQTILDTVAVSA